MMQLHQPPAKDAQVKGSEQGDDEKGFCNETFRNYSDDSGKEIA
jgi:hypothetical protein